MITNEKQLTVDEVREAITDFDIDRFMVRYEDDTHITAMTSENFNTYYWQSSEADINPATKEEQRASLLKSLFEWLKDLFRILSGLFADSAEK